MDRPVEDFARRIIEAAVLRDGITVASLIKYLEGLHGYSLDDHEWSMELPDLGSEAHTPAMLFAFRFLTAWANADAVMCRTLFDVALGAPHPGDYLAAMRQFVFLVGSIKRAASGTNQDPHLPQ